MFCRAKTRCHRNRAKAPSFWITFQSFRKARSTAGCPTPLQLGSGGGWTPHHARVLMSSFLANPSKDRVQVPVTMIPRKGKTLDSQNLPSRCWLHLTESKGSAACAQVDGPRPIFRTIRGHVTPCELLQSSHSWIGSPIVMKKARRILGWKVLLYLTSALLFAF